MSSFIKTLELNNITYKISFEISTYRHLCSFYELYNLNISKTVFNEQFMTSTEVSSSKFTRIDYEIFLNLFAESAEDIGCDKKGILYTMNTGTASRWSYDELGEKLDPLIDILPVQSSMELYSQDIYFDEYEDEKVAYKPEEGYYVGTETLTMFNIDHNNIDSKLSTEAQAYIEENTKKPEPKVSAPTKSAIKEWLKSA